MVWMVEEWFGLAGRLTWLNSPSVVVDEWFGWYGRLQYSRGLVGSRPNYWIFHPPAALASIILSSHILYALKAKVCNYTSI